MSPSPPVIGNLDFRRALLYAIDRQQMVDSLLDGQTSVAHTFLAPNQAPYREIEARVMRYEFDPARAKRMIEGLGYTLGPDGVYRDGSGQRLSVELRAIPNDLYPRAILAIADYWRRVGIAVDELIIPAPLVRDTPWRTTFPGFEILAGAFDVNGIGQLHSSKARVPENRFVGSNYSRYVNPKFDALIDRFYVTIPRQERTEILGQIIAHIQENLNTMGLMYNAIPVMIGNRVTGVRVPTAPRGSATSTSYLWDVT